jgi:hypothetical protein
VNAGLVEVVEVPETEPVTAEVAEEATAEPTREEIRAWAIANDIQVSEKGNLAKSVIEAYNAAH